MAVGVGLELVVAEIDVDDIVRVELSQDAVAVERGE
jgi:hypothetical protein